MSTVPNLAAPLRPEEMLDYQAPNYDEIVSARIARLRWLRSGTPAEQAQRAADMRAFYSMDDNAAQFITDWCVTADPRNAERNLPVVMPFILWPKQREFVAACIEQWRAGKGLEVCKSRDQGASWLAMAVSIWFCVFHRDINIGFGSRKEELVDKAGDPKCLFHKGRTIMAHLPVEFRGGWRNDKHCSAHMRLSYPEQGSTITGEAGDNIGRGDRTALYFVDEAAYLEHPDLVDASLVATTNCRIEMSSVNGMANKFAERVHSGKHRVLMMDWRTDPRRNQAWYDNLVETVDPVVVAGEYDMDFSASVEGQVLPSKWVQAMIDAHLRIKNFPMGGTRRGAFDVADLGRDANAFCHMHGLIIEGAEDWPGEGDGAQTATVKAYALADTYKLDEFLYDSDGMGGPVRGFVGNIEAARAAAKQRRIAVGPFRGSAEVLNPEARVPGSPDRLNKDYFANFKAQCWWALRQRALATYHATLGRPYDPQMLISIKSGFKHQAKLVLELSQPVWKPLPSGKYVVDKLPDGARSPNLADSAMMCASPRTGLRISSTAVDELERALTD